MYVCLHDLIIDLSGIFFFFCAREQLPCSCHFLFRIKEVNAENVSKPICVSKRPLRNSGLCCLWYVQRHLSLIYLFTENEREGEREKDGWREKCSRNQCCLHEIWCCSILIIDICFFMHPDKKRGKKNKKQGLPLRNYSNDLQQCMFSYSFVVRIWEHILTSQLLMQGSEWAQWMQSPCVQSSVTPNHQSSRTDTHNSDKSDRICIQRLPQKKKKKEGINKKCTVLGRKRTQEGEEYRKNWKKKKKDLA